MAGVVDTLLFRPPAGVPHPDRVVGVGPWAGFERTTYPDYTDIRDGAHAFEAVGAFAAWQYTARIGNVAVPARGMLPPSFTAPDLSPVDLVVPITNAPHFGAPASLTSRDFYWVRIVGRLRPGVTTGQASAEATAIYRRANPEVDGTTAAMLARTTGRVRSLVEARRAAAVDPATVLRSE